MKKLIPVLLTLVLGSFAQAHWFESFDGKAAKLLSAKTAFTYKWVALDPADHGRLPESLIIQGSTSQPGAKEVLKGLAEQIQLVRKHKSLDPELGISEANFSCDRESRICQYRVAILNDKDDATDDQSSVLSFKVSPKADKIEEIESGLNLKLTTYSKIDHEFDQDQEK